MMQKSIILGTGLGAAFGVLIGAGFGAITASLNGILIGLLIGLVLGAITGALTAALTVKTAGTTGGVSVGAYTGMGFGAVFGMIIGVLIPTSLRMSANSEGMPVLDALMMGRFETAILDGDGVPDSSDDYPNDSAKASPPSAAGTGKIIIDAYGSVNAGVSFYGIDTVRDSDPSVNQSGKPADRQFPDGLITFTINGVTLAAPYSLR